MRLLLLVLLIGCTQVHHHKHECKEQPFVLPVPPIPSLPVPEEWVYPCETDDQLHCWRRPTQPTKVLRYSIPECQEENGWMDYDCYVTKPIAPVQR